MRVFLSHNKSDKSIARSIGAQLVLLRAGVWFDEWEIQAGDSIPGKLNEGLEHFDFFLLLWSKFAKKSKWVRQELNTAIMRSVQDSSVKIIPCKIDETEIPALISDRRHVDLSDVQAGIDELVASITGIRTRNERLKAIQGALDDMDLRWTDHPAVGPLICCPDCGDEDSLEPSTAYDDKRDDTYWGLKCSMCGWEGSGEA